ncbi:MAG: hypothetical protein JO283_08935 [Bradyrhizobium sp.]|nr:hypothetical protein [Bradyrhizobium sp.]
MNRKLTQHSEERQTMHAKDQTALKQVKQLHRRASQRITMELVSWSRRQRASPDTLRMARKSLLSSFAIDKRRYPNLREMQKVQAVTHRRLEHLANGDGLVMHRRARRRLASSSPLQAACDEFCTPEPSLP